MLAIVTGGSRGIGAAIVKKLLKKGYKVIATARKESEETIALKAEYGDSFMFQPCDNSVSADREQLVSTALANFGSIDLLVNNAGVAPRTRKDMLDITEDDYDFTIDINTKGMFFLTQLVANVMKGQGSGRIANISSVSSYTVSVNRAEYCIAKAGVSMVTKLFAVRMAEYGVGVFEVSPGIIATDMTAGVSGKYQELIDNGLTPIKRFGTPEDIAKVVGSIADGALDFCTGTVIHADGGFSLRTL
ncbi:MAG: 3-ketoacyl-ACP reductase [Bacillota bacterium]